MRPPTSRVIVRGGGRSNNHRTQMWTPLYTFGPVAILDCLPARAMTANETPGVARLAAAEHRHRIHRRRAFADLEMELRRVDIAGLAGLGDHLAPLDRIAPLDHQLLGMSVGGDVAIRMPDQHEIAIALQLAAGIGNDAVLGGFHRRSFRDCEINAVILLAVGAGTEAGDDARLDRPAERWGRTFDRFEAPSSGRRRFASRCHHARALARHTRDAPL